MNFSRRRRENGKSRQNPREFGRNGRVGRGKNGIFRDKQREKGREGGGGGWGWTFPGFLAAPTVGILGIGVLGDGVEVVGAVLQVGGTLRGEKTGIWGFSQKKSRIGEVFPKKAEILGIFPKKNQGFEGFSQKKQGSFPKR